MKVSVGFGVGPVRVSWPVGGRRRPARPRGVRVIGWCWNVLVDVTLWAAARLLLMLARIAKEAERDQR
jgi:hypothetical protein